MERGVKVCGVRSCRFGLLPIERGSRSSGVSMTMDVRYVNPFIEAVRSVFKTMLDTEILTSNPFVVERGQPSSDVSAVIGYTGDASGSVALCFSRHCATKIASKFAGAEVTTDHPDFADALGELANMVAGSAKSKMEGLNISISLPRVIAGSNLHSLKSSGIPMLGLPCDSVWGRFCLEVAMVLETKAKPVQSATPG